MPAHPGWPAKGAALFSSALGFRPLPFVLNFCYHPHMAAITQTSRVKQHVLELIRNNAFDADEPLFSERQLCEATGTSRTTVRRALKELIEAGILVPRRGRGTFVNPDALRESDQRRIRQGRIGILFFGQYITTPGPGYGWVVLQAINQTLHGAGWSLTHLTPDTPGTLAAERLAAQPVDGLIWVSPSPNERPTIEALHERGVPLLLVNQRCEPRSVPSVMVDRRREGRLAAEHLLELGHRDILFVGMDDERPHLADRYSGFAEAFLRYRAAHPADLTQDCYPAGEVEDRLRAFLRKGRPCSAMFIADALYLPAAIAALRDEGRRIPEDISLVAHSVLDETLLQMLRPTQVLAPLHELGRRAAERIMALAEGRADGPLHELLAPNFDPGRTCRPA
jgi:DNA-binding LacI/PurR family transcriptional regulator